MEVSELFTEQLTKAIGSTVSDIWFLVFGGIGHLAEKRKLRYAVELENYNRELHEKIEAIPNEKRVEPDIQIVSKFNILRQTSGVLVQFLTMEILEFYQENVHRYNAPKH